jgi:F-type H+-transporting ATPase subunit delta
MAENRTLARPYANALFDLARDGGTLPAWSAALEALAVALRDARVVAILERPSLEDPARVELVTDLAQALDPEAAAMIGGAECRNLLRLLADNGRLAVLPDIAMLFAELKDREENSVDVTVVAAVELDTATREAMVGALEQRLNRKVRLQSSVDASLIGGAVLRAGDLVIDGSVRSRLHELANTLTR